MGATRVTGQDVADTTVTTADLADAAVTLAKLAALTTKGDLLAFDTAHARIPVGTDGQVLTADSSETKGVKWADPASALDPDDFLLLAGRTAPANDPTLSDTGFGSVYGSSAAAPFNGLNINATSDATLGPFSLINLNANVTQWNGTNALLAFGLYQAFITSTAITLNDVPGDSAADIVGFPMIGQFLVGDDSEGGPHFEMVQFSPSIGNPSGVAKHLVKDAKVFQFSPDITSDGAACDVDNIAAYTSFPSFHTTGGGTLSISKLSTFDVRYSTDSGVTLDLVGGYYYEGAVGSGTVTNDHAYVCFDASATVTGEHCSFISHGPLRRMVHHGPAVFGFEAPPTTASVGLELRSDHTAFLPSRLNNSEEAALTATEGMFLRNTDLGAFRGYDGAAWVSFLTDDGAGNVVIPGTSGKGYVEVEEYDTTNDPSTPAAGRARLYVRDDGSGKVQLAILFPSGAAIPIATEA
jgi:hypothetical protein